MGESARGERKEAFQKRKRSAEEARLIDKGVRRKAIQMKADENRRKSSIRESVRREIGKMFGVSYKRVNLQTRLDYSGEDQTLNGMVVSIKGLGIKVISI